MTSAQRGWTGAPGKIAAGGAAEIVSRLLHGRAGVPFARLRCVEIGANAFIFADDLRDRGTVGAKQTDDQVGLARLTASTCSRNHELGQELELTARARLAVAPGFDEEALRERVLGLRFALFPARMPAR